MQWKLSLALIVFQLLSIVRSSPLPLGSVAPTGELTARSTPETYIVIFETGSDTPDSVVKSLETGMKKLGAKVIYEYQTIIKGFSISLDSDLLPDLRQLSTTEYPFIVEVDKAVHTLA